MRAVSLASIQRWHKRYLTAGADMRALIPHFATRGKAGASRLRPAIDAIIAQAIEELYLIAEVATADDVWLEVQAVIADRNAAAPTEEPLQPPSLRTIERRIAVLVPDKVRRAKFGARGISRCATTHPSAHARYDPASCRHRSPLHRPDRR